MNATVFVDTPVFLYAHHANEPARQAEAAHWLKYLWTEQSGRTSVQVLSEFYLAMTVKIQPCLKQDEAWDLVRPFMTWDPMPTDAELMRRARDLERRYSLRWWDSLVVAAAQAQNCTLLLSHNLPERSTFGSVIVRNPFNLAVSEAMETYVAAPIVIPRHRFRGRPRKLAGHSRHSPLQ